MKKQMRGALRRGWQYLARTLPERQRQDLPGWAYLEMFVWGWLSCEPDQRAYYLQQYAAEGTPYVRMLRRAGGIRQAFRLVVKPEQLDPDTLARFETPEQPDPTLDSIAVSVITAGQFVGLPKDLMH